MSGELVRAAPRGDDELDELLSEPTAATIDAVRGLAGDLMILGAGGKMGPSLAHLARRSLDAAGRSSRVICVSRFSDPAVREWLEMRGIDSIPCDLLDRRALEALPDVNDVVLMAGFKFGASIAPHRLWAMNCLLPAGVAERYATSRIVALSTGNVYPYVPPGGGGAVETTTPEPVGEYAQSCLGRERVLAYASERSGTPIALIRLNYATDLRYGVLVDVATTIAAGEAVDLSMGFINTIWQGDANAVVLRAFGLCASPPDVLNLTGPEVVSVRDAASRMSALMGLPAPAFTGTEPATALLSNASRCQGLFGPPRVSLDTLVAWTADWVGRGGTSLDKPTHFATRDGAY